MASAKDMRRGETIDLLLLGAMGLLAIHAVAALALRVGAYADGAWFDFALAVGRPFELVWRNYPARLTHYLVQYLPAWLLLRLGAPLTAALFLAHAIWQFAPLASLWACWRLAPPERRDLALAPAAFFVLAGLLTWGFPTEIWLLAAFAWPAFFALAYGRGPSVAALGAVLLVAVLLSYETGIVLLPILMWAAFTRKDEGAPPMRRAVIVGAVVGLAFLAVAMALMKPTPLISAQLRGNITLILNPFAPLTAPAVRKELVIGLAAIVLAPAAMGPRWLRLSALGGLILIGLVVALANFGDFAVSHYLARSACLGALVLGLIALQGFRIRPLSSPPSTAVQHLLIAGALAMGAAVTVENLRFALVWRDHVQAIVAAADCGRVAGPCRPGDVVALPAAQDSSTARWGWGLPFRSLMLAPDVRRARLVRDWQAYASPLDCASAKALTWPGGRPPALDSLTAGICGTGPRLSP